MAQRSFFQKFKGSCLNLWSHKIRRCYSEKWEKCEDTSIYNYKSVNEVKLLGFVGQTPKQFHKENNCVTHFTMATNRYYYDKSDALQKITTWHTIIVRKNYLQDYVKKYVSKGTRVYVSGYLDDHGSDFVEDLEGRSPVFVAAQEVIYFKRNQLSHEDSPYFLGGTGSYRASE